MTTFSSHQIYDIFITKMGTVELLDEIILYVDCISISGVTSDCEIIAPYPFVVSVATFPSAAHMQGPLGRENTCAA